MPLVLIPTDDMMVIPGITSEYSRQGFDVVVGKRNFFLGLHRAELVHYVWPEEFSDWQLPSARVLEEIQRCVIRWAGQCPTVVTVSNFYPHGYDGHPMFQRLYNVFYEHCAVIVHHSKTSHEMVLREFPVSRDKRHVVAPYYNFDRLLPAKSDRAASRRSFGFRDDDFVVLVFGAIRFWRELRLVQDAFSMARVRGKRLLMAGRYVEKVGRWRRVWRSTRRALWERRNRVTRSTGYIPDDDVHRYLEAADVLLIPRLTDMTSGLVGLGYTFGRLMIAPNHGAHPEYLAGTDNLLYESGNSASLARAIERAAKQDPDRVARQNRQRADEWTWDRIVGPCVRAAME